MIIIIAAGNDESARLLATRWETFDARLLGPKDLSISGWRYQPHIGTEYTAVVNDRPVAGADIAGVLTRLPWISEQDVPHVVPQDRAYVASEMTAFLTSWLSGLKCPVLNRPTPTCLAGPPWRRERWLHLAARAGIPVCPVHRDTRQGRNQAQEDALHPIDTVTVVAGRCFGASDRLVASYAKRLARDTRVDLLAARFKRLEGVPRLASADVWPDITAPAVADAVLDCLLRRETC